MCRSANIRYPTFMTFLPAGCGTLRNAAAQRLASEFDDGIRTGRGVVEISKSASQQRRNSQHLKMVPRDHAAGEGVSGIIAAVESDALQARGSREVGEDVIAPPKFFEVQIWLDFIEIDKLLGLAHGQRAEEHVIDLREDGVGANAKG